MKEELTEHELNSYTLNVVPEQTEKAKKQEEERIANRKRILGEKGFEREVAKMEKTKDYYLGASSEDMARLQAAGEKAREEAIKADLAKKAELESEDSDKAKAIAKAEAAAEKARQKAEQDAEKAREAKEKADAAAEKAKELALQTDADKTKE